MSNCKIFLESLKESPNNFECLFNIDKCLLNENPNNFECLFNIGKCLIEEKDFKSDEAIKYLLKALEVGKDTKSASILAEVNFCIYTAYKQSNRRAISKIYIDEAIRLEPRIENRLPMANRANY